MKKADYFIIILLLVATFPAIQSLLPPGFFNTHDGPFHLIRLFHFYNELISGQFPVRWAQDMAFWYGYPVFNYYYPLPYYIGSLFYFVGFSLGESIKSTITVSLIGSVIFFYIFLRNFFQPFPSAIGALFYLYTPYRFLATYVNGTLGVIISFLWLPLILLFLTKLMRTKKIIYLPLLSLALFSLITSHNSSTVMFLPIILGYFLVLLYQSSSKFKDLKRFSLALLLSLGLSSFFILPALTEISYVKLGHIEVHNSSEHFPTIRQLIYSPWGYGFSDSGINDQLSFQVGIAQWIVVVFSILILFKKILINKIYNQKFLFPLFWLAVFILNLFFMLKASQIFWLLIPLLSELQFPWKLLSVSMLTTALLAAYVSSQKVPKLLLIILCLILFFTNRNYLRPLEARRFDDWHYQKENYFFNGSADTSWETLPIWVKKTPLSFRSSILSYPKGVAVTNFRFSKEFMTFIADSPKAAKISANIFYFPGWTTKIDNKLVTNHPEGNLGLITFDIPRGKHNINLSLVDTPPRKIGNIISSLSFIIWGISLFLILLRNQDNQGRTLNLLL